MELIDFSNCTLSSRNLQYAGRAGDKRGIIYNNENWFLKFPKSTLGMDHINDLSYVTSPISEYIGSHIYEILGYDVHKTILGYCFDGKRTKIVCACKDFIIDDSNETLIQYTALRNDADNDLSDHNDNSYRSTLSLSEIEFQLKNNTILKTLKDSEKRFWDCVVVDLIINNNDRNEDNWGVIKFKDTNTYQLAPIYDNGNSFYSKNDEGKILHILSDKNRLCASSLDTITAYEDDNESRITLRKMLENDNPCFRESLIFVYNAFINHFDEIKKMIKDIPTFLDDILVMSDARKVYYIETMKYRLDAIKKVLEN